MPHLRTVASSGETAIRLLRPKGNPALLYAKARFM